MILNIEHADFLTSMAFRNSFIVNSPIDRVWEFYTAIKHLEIVTPTELEVKFYEPKAYPRLRNLA